MSVRRLAEKQPASFEFTPENKAWAEKEIAKYPPGRQASAVIALLWRAQKQNDYWLSKPAIEKVAEILDMPKIRVLEVATFYTMFNLEPVGRYYVQLCGTTPCMLRGSEDIKAVLRKRVGAPDHVTSDGLFSWSEVECLGACCNAPMVQINDDYYEDLTPENFAKLLDDLAAGRQVRTGSQIGRVSSEPVGGLTALTSLYGADSKGRGQGTPAPANDPAVGGQERLLHIRDAAAQARDSAQKTDSATPPQPQARSLAQSSSSGEPSARAAAQGAPTPPLATKAAQPTGDAPPSADKTADGGRAQLAPLDEKAEQARADAEEAHIKTELAKLPSDATPEEKANAVGARPPALQAARGGTADNLQRIKGVGPTNEKRLHELGVFHFDQIAAWTLPEVRWVGTYLAFPGRIHRERWVAQASNLSQDGTSLKGRDLATRIDEKSGA
jgi:NADH-quinone oxidoreductase subunit E